MERYQFPEEQRAWMESLRQPFAVYQMIGKRIETLLLSDGFLKLFGYTDRAAAYRDMDYDMYREVHPDDVARISNAAVRFATEGGRYEVIYRSRTLNGSEYRMIHACGEHVNTETGVRIAQVWYTDEGKYLDEANTTGEAIHHAMSNALHEQSILRASRYDDLTGLPSMTYFFKLAESAKAAILERGGEPVVMYLDFSGMKFFNSRHGFAEGDKMLQSFAKLLANAFGSENSCRIGADHFAAVAENTGLEDRLQGLFQECNEMHTGKVPPVHVGIYTDRKEGTHISTACDRAKLACSALKGTYTSGFRYYSSELSDDLERRQYVIENLDAAMAGHWIQVYYQPIIRAVNEKVCDVEALARWIDPCKGFLSPGDFIPYLEDAGLLYKLDLYILEEVLRTMRCGKEAGMDVVPHSVNLSRSDFEACDIVEEICRRVDDAGISRNRITIEITESVIGSDFDFMKGQIERFQKLGFPVWMDDFGSGYSSLDVLQSIKFDLIKFDMSFMRKLDEGESAKIILTELMKMATALGVDTVCEGVETETQARFLQDVGCSKMQGYYFCKPVPFEEILRRMKTGFQFGHENPAETSYYESIGRVNLYDLTVISDSDGKIHNTFNTLPAGIVEIRDSETRFVRTNQSYRDFFMRFFGVDLSAQDETFNQLDGSFMHNIKRTCCEQGGQLFFDEKMQDGSVVHSFARRVSVNPVTGNVAVAITVLSISEPREDTTYAEIARALAADYYNIYVIDLDTENFIEYSSTAGRDELARKRQGEGFFASAQRDTMTRIYEEDRAAFLALFTKENVVKELNAQGVFTTTYRLIDTGVPMYVNMKITRLQPGSSRIIMGISIIDSQMKEKKRLEDIQKERDTLARVMALSDGYVCLYTVNLKTGSYVEYNATSEYESLGFAKEGNDFFMQGTIDAVRTIYEEDLPLFLQRFTRDNVLREIKENGDFKLSYRLMMGGEPRKVSMRIASFGDVGEEKLVVGVRTWIIRKQ
ncbi:MAG: GGDEF and EAL domain-containing protein [Clostridia bacterium]|nr:GGDEF and EAL domain-containing protein [Clostridia bacterium]